MNISVKEVDMRIVVYNSQGGGEIEWETRDGMWVNVDAPEEQFYHDEFLKDEFPEAINRLAQLLADEAGVRRLIIAR